MFVVNKVTVFVFCLHRALQGFFFAHFPLFESHVKRLRVTVENACFSKTKSFTSQVSEVRLPNADL